jgi:hypothetical protein
MHGDWDISIDFQTTAGSSFHMIQEAKQLIATNAEVKNWIGLESLIRNHCDPQIIGLLLRRGVNPNELTVAANILSIEHTRLLLRYGANPNEKDASGETPLHDLASSFNRKPGDTEKKLTIAKILFQHKAQLHLKDAAGNTPFDVALDSYNTSKNPEYDFKELAQLLQSESRYRLAVEVECTRRKNFSSSGLAQLPKDVIKIIIFKIYPSLDHIFNKTP